MKYQLLLLAVLLTGCKETSKVVEFNETLSAESVVLAEAMFSVPMDVQKVDDVLYASSFNGDSLLHCYSLARGEWIQSLLPQGQGPGEFISPVEVFFQSDSLLFVHTAGVSRPGVTGSIPHAVSWRLPTVRLGCR